MIVSAPCAVMKFHDDMVALYEFQQQARGHRFYIVMPATYFEFSLAQWDLVWHKWVR